MTRSKCPYCEFIYNTFIFDDLTPREYWLMTEVFVYLHNGKDYCDHDNPIRCSDNCAVKHKVSNYPSTEAIDCYHICECAYCPIYQEKEHE